MGHSTFHLTIGTPRGREPNHHQWSRLQRPRVGTHSPPLDSSPLPSPPRQLARTKATTRPVAAATNSWHSPTSPLIPLWDWERNSIKPLISSNALWKPSSKGHLWVLLYLHYSLPPTQRFYQFFLQRFAGFLVWDSCLSNLNIVNG